MIPDFKTYIGESVWNDIRKRGSGSSVKKEDDVDILDIDGFIDYLKTHYKGIGGSWLMTAKDDCGTISVCICENEDGCDNYLCYENIENDPEVLVLGGIYGSSEYLYDELKSNYTVTHSGGEDMDGHPIEYIKIEPKGCRYIKLTNKFFLEVLDYLLERIHQPLKKQIVKI